MDENNTPAHWFKRLLASAIDVSIYFSILLILFSMGNFNAIMSLLFLVSLVLIPSIYMGCEKSSWKASPGKKALGLEIQSTGKNASDRILLHTLIKYVLLWSVLGCLFWVNYLNDIYRENLPFFLLLTLGPLGLGFFLIDIGRGGQNIWPDALLNVQVVQNSEPSYGVIFFRVGAFSVLPIVLMLISFPNYVASEPRAKVSSVKANMHTMQTMVETYAVDWGGFYPDNLEQLYNEANKYAYWKDFSNPYTGQSGLNNSYTAEPPLKKTPGIVTYEATRYMRDIYGRGYIGYFIYGYNKSGDRIQNKGQDFYLTNG